MEISAKYGGSVAVRQTHPGDSGAVSITNGPVYVCLVGFSSESLRELAAQAEFVANRIDNVLADSGRLSYINAIAADEAGEAA